MDLRSLFVGMVFGAAGMLLCVLALNRQVAPMQGRATLPEEVPPLAPLGSNVAAAKLAGEGAKAGVAKPLEDSKRRLAVAVTHEGDTVGKSRTVASAFAATKKSTTQATKSSQSVAVVTIGADELDLDPGY